MRILVCGGRDFNSPITAWRALDLLHEDRGIDVLIEGDAPGADRIAGAWARRHDIENLKFRAKWKTFGRAAGPIRNQQMLEEGRPELVVAFPGGRGTADMVERAEGAGIEVYYPLS